MSFRAEIQGQAVDVDDRETLLDAALRAGIDFPHSCKVGGCGTCACRIAGGRVRELTESGYLLTEEQLNDSYVLACQSVPVTDVKVDVNLRYGTRGRVVQQAALTHDIVRLTVQLEKRMDYRAGQFARLRIEGLNQVTRSYSFATPASAEGEVVFFIRRVPGGAFSTLVNDEDVLGRAVWVDGPHGDFWLRPGESPLVLVAGGSGLAPILALLKDAVAAGVSRKAVLYFGARTQRDLYAQDELRAIERDWHGDFQWVPVLSEASADDEWQGCRGLVTEHIKATPNAEGYLCGPPAMVDAAIDALSAQGVRQVFYDRFVTAGDTPKDERAGFFDYLKFFGFHAVGLISFLALVAGSAWTTAGLLGVLAYYILGDGMLGDDESTPRYERPAVLTAQLWLALPLLSLIVFAAVWSVSPNDVLGFGQAVEWMTGYDALHAREGTNHLSGWILTGLMIGLVGTIPAHELTHRTWDRTSMVIGRALLAFSFDTIFSIEHVYGHHRYVSTEEDPATAPRGRNAYTHILVSTFKGNVSAWRIEADRLRKKKLPLFSRHNAFVRGHLLSVGLVIAAGLLGGIWAAAYFLACALLGKALLEVVNYMEHYGIVRNPERPVEPRHSWNTNRRVSSWTMFNLTRHSHHHAQGEVPYHQLKPYADAPMMLSGYLTTLVIALIPPLWHALMTPKLLQWDRNFATPEERVLAAAANETSGVRGLSPKAAVMT
ncbi:MAG: fatty acid desaturase [Myxococcota bacterium]